MLNDARIGWVITLGVLLFSLAFVTRVDACPPNQYESCFLGACVCLPEIGGTVGDTFEHIKKETEGQTAGRALEQWLIASRNTSVGTSQPIPLQIRGALTGYVEDRAMNNARFKVGDNGALNLAGLTLAYGDAFGNSVMAVTLIDVIVFRNEADAYNNPSLWAHELTHVKQFMDWGTNNFAISYVRDVGSVEDSAYAVGNGYPAWAATRFTTQSPPFPVLGLPPGYGMQVCRCVGPYPQPAPEPRCQSGAVRPNICQGVCPGGVPPYAYVCQ